REFLHFQRHGESRQVTDQKDALGDSGAWQKIVRTETDCRTLAFGNGRIAPFPGNLVHRQLLELVICYEIAPLTADELAHCFDTCCVCGKEHDADALRKMRVRLEQELRARAPEPSD